MKPRERKRERATLPTQRPRKPPPTDGTTHGFHQAPSLTARPQDQVVGCPGDLVACRITGRQRVAKTGVKVHLGQWLVVVQRHGDASQGVRLSRPDRAFRVSPVRYSLRLNAPMGQSSRTPRRNPAAHDSSSVTVRDAVHAYLADRHTEGQDTSDSRRQLETHVLPHFGSRRVADLGAAELKAWRDALVATAPRVRRPKNALQARHAAVDLLDAEVRRRRRSTANRIATTFKAVLNHASRLAPDDFPNREAWRQGLRAFRRVERPRDRWLALEEVKRLVEACSEPPFRQLVLAALYTGCRYGELRRARVGDYVLELPALRIPVTKSGRWRDVFLHDEAAAFFAVLTTGRAADERLLERSPGIPWGISQQARRIAAACKTAQIPRPISFHGLRHTYASLSVQAGMTLIALARNLGHADTRMVEKYYGHLSDGYMRAQVRFAPGLRLCEAP